MTTLELNLPRFEELDEDDQKVVAEILELAYIKILYGLEVEGKRRKILSELDQKTRWLTTEDLEGLISRHL